MEQEIEISTLDLRYEHCRLRHRPSEKALLSSILENGVREAVMGINTVGGRYVLLDGFKRVRCLKIIGRSVAPFISLGDNESSGIVSLLRTSITRGLNILEQAQLITELKNLHKLSVADIAFRLEKSKAWVSMRSSLIEGMSDLVRQKLFAGQFPVYSYMYTLRQFMRMNGINKSDVDQFVSATSGKNLSIRDIERLAYGYFKGPETFKSQIAAGNIGWGLEHLKKVSYEASACDPCEQILLGDLEVVVKYMERTTYKSIDVKLKSPSFFAQAEILSRAILSKIDQRF